MKKLSKVLKVTMVLMIVFLPIYNNLNVVFASDDTTITIFHTNDMHGAIEDLSYVRTLKENTHNSILVDAGDATQGSALATYTQGKGVIQLMNAAGYDGMTYGNHEFDYGSQIALNNAKEATFPVVSANTLDKDGNLLLGNINSNNGKSFIIEKEGIKIGFFGITTTEASYKTNPVKLDGVTFDDEIKTAQREVNELKNNVDVIVALCHVGVDATSDPTSHDIAKQVSGIDVIIDGHSHTEQNSVVNNTYIAQTGTKLSKLGKVEITLDTNKNITNIQSQLISDYKTGITPNSTYKALYDQKLLSLKPILDEKVSINTMTLFAEYDNVRLSRLEETPIGDLVADAMKYQGEKIIASKNLTMPVVALQNGGGCRADIKKGNITVGDVFTVLPFGNTVAIKEITPKVLYETLANGYKSIEVKETGYLNIEKVSGAFAQISGMKVIVDLTKPSGSIITHVYLVDNNGKETLLNKDDTNTKIAIVSNDFEIAGGDGYTMLGILPHISEGGPLDVALQEYIKSISKQGTLAYSALSKRLIVKQIQDIQNTGYLNVIPNIKLVPNTTYSVKIDNNLELNVQTNQEGYFTLKSITNGMHTLTIDNKDYYISSYTKVGIKDITVVDAPIQDEVIEESKDVVQTSDKFYLLTPLMGMSIAGIYIFYFRKKASIISV